MLITKILLPGVQKVISGVVFFLETFFGIRLGPENLMLSDSSTCAGTSPPGLLAKPEWLPAVDRRPGAKRALGRQSLQTPAEAESSEVRLLLF